MIIRISFHVRHICALSIYFSSKNKGQSMLVIFLVSRGFRVPFIVPNGTFLSFKILMLKAEP